MEECWVPYYLSHWCSFNELKRDFTWRASKVDNHTIIGTSISFFFIFLSFRQERKQCLWLFNRTFKSHSRRKDEGIPKPETWYKCLQQSRSHWRHPRTRSDSFWPPLAWVWQVITIQENSSLELLPSLMVQKTISDSLKIGSNNESVRVQVSNWLLIFFYHYVTLSQHFDINSHWTTHMEIFTFQFYIWTKMYLEASGWVVEIAIHFQFCCQFCQ